MLMTIYNMGISSAIVRYKFWLPIELCSRTFYPWWISSTPIPNFFKSPNTPSVHWSLGLPTVLPSSLKFMILLCISLLPILCKCPANHSLATLIVLIRSSGQWSWCSCWLYLILHSLFSCTGQYILHNIFLSKVHSHNSSDCGNVYLSLPSIGMGLTRVLYIMTLISSVSSRDFKCLWNV